jgi:ubiquinone/menaquinone biosynthesis C-methylase UbiE
MTGKFGTAAMAEGYATARPPLHAGIVGRIGVRARRALDVGCGAGLSTRPLLDVAERVYGVDAAPEMVRWAARLVPGAFFAGARVEALPFRDGTFDLITAAGSLNYAEPVVAFRELRRVISPDGTLCIYDFSQADFPYQRPPDGGVPLSPEDLACMDTGFEVIRSERFAIPVSMTHQEYVAYLETELSVPTPAFQPKWELVFSGYIAWLTPMLREPLRR